MIDILMVTPTPRDGVGSRNSFELQNVSFSRDKKIDVDQTCIIKVSRDEQHPNGNSYVYPQICGGKKRVNVLI